MTATPNCIFVCNKLLWGELSAFETYNQALERFVGSSEEVTLEQILDDHRKSADNLRDHVAGMGGVPDSASGI